MPTSDMI